MAILPCLLAFQVVAGQHARAATAPVVTGVSPDTGAAVGSTSVTITGSGFTGATAVDFGPVPVFGSIPADSFTVVSDTEITATLGQNGDFAGTTDVTVTTPEGTSATSAADQITFVLPPTMTSISPNNGPIAGGNTVTITGTGFTGATKVIFDTEIADASGVASDDPIEAPSFTVDSDTEITAVAPALPNGALQTGGPVSVITPYGDSAETSIISYVWNPLPVVTGTTPAMGVAIGGEQVTLTGTGFTNASAVSFGSTPATSFTVVSDTKIVAIAPAVALTDAYPSGLPYNLLDITVTTPNGTSLGTLYSQFTYVASPVITGVSPAAGPAAGGNTVTITGTGFRFSRALEVAGLSFGSTPVTNYTVNSATQITATVPPGAVGTVDIGLTAEGNVTSPTSPADQYTYLPVPTVTGVSPGSGPSVGGNTVTVTGTGFTDASAVSFGSTPATSFTVNSDSSITATVPAGAVGIDDVTVTTPGGTSATSAADQYVYHPTCTTTITGTNSSKITVSSGLTCLVDATQSGQVTVEAGAALSVTDSTVSGAVTATDPAGITYCGSTESGNLIVTGATGPVVLSGALPDGTACAADTISGAVTVNGASAPVTVTGVKERGTLTLENDTAGVALDGGQLNGLAYVSDNTATTPAAITVSGVAVTGSLYCTGNSPAPTDGGTVNTVSAPTASDQCTNLEEQ
jgi:hypothetical protein